MSTVVGKGKICNGLKLFYNGLENHHQYRMKIWKNFKGITYEEFGRDDKRITCEVFHYKVSSWDYQTAFTLLRTHFDLVKGV